jgi:6,7-dimethyl-8-ribityllumazine synthase
MNKKPQNVYEGTLDAKGRKVAIVCSRFNEFFVGKLLEGALDLLVRSGVRAEDIDLAWVPGAMEIPLAASRFAAAGRHDAVIALGVVIQGATPHAGQINAEVTKCLAQIGLNSGIPVINGVIAANDLEQAIERSGTKAGNRGADAARAAIEMASLLRAMPGGKKK